MKLAIVSVTNKGALLAERLAGQLAAQVDVYVKSGRNPSGTGREFSSLSRLLETIFGQYQGFIFVMATGIVVRVVAAHILDKRFDPAVIALDEAGRHAISLLSGHIGGANELTRLVAAAAGASPVITTASDLAELPAADVLAVKLGLAIDPFAQMKAINAAIVNGEAVEFYIDMDLTEAAAYIRQAKELGVSLTPLTGESPPDDLAAVVITDRQLPAGKVRLYLRPKTLAVGIGCRKGTSSAEILAALGDACEKSGRSMNSIDSIASTVYKQNEPGLLDAIEQLSAKSCFFSNEQLERCVAANNLGISAFVKEKIGVGNVCEAAALTAGRTEKLLLPKTKYSKVAIAIAEVKLQ